MATAVSSANGATAESRAYTRIDWKHAAALIAGGQTVEAAAAALSLPAERVWRHLNRSLRFRHYIRQAVERQRLQAELHLAAAGRETLLALSRDGAALDAAGLQWLAAESGLAGCGTRRAAERRGEGEDLVMQLAATADRPPNQALRRRLKAEKADMDRFMAAARMELDATRALLVAAGDLPPRPGDLAPDETVTGGPQRSPAVTNGHERSPAVRSGPEQPAPRPRGNDGGDSLARHARAGGHPVFPPGSDADGAGMPASRLRGNDAGEYLYPDGA